MKKKLIDYPGFVPIPALIVIIAVLNTTVNPSLFYDPAWLIPITNTIFIAAVCFVVAWIAFRNYRGSGRIQILFLGCGVLIFGIGGAIAGFVRGLPDGANLNVTIYNTGALVGALFHFAAAMMLVAGVSPEAGSQRKELWSVAGYLGVILFMALLSTASFGGAIPPFFVQGKGPTVLRQTVLGSADILFAFSFLIFIATYFRNREKFLYWYSLALALTSISLTAFFIQHSVGSPVGWAGRCSQYLGGIYFLIALLTAIRAATTRKTTLDTIVTSSFSPGEERFRALADHSPDIIARVDREMIYLYVNQAGLKVHGKRPHEVIGKTVEEAGLSREYSSLWIERIQQVFATGETVEVEEFVPTMEGIKFYHSLCVPEFSADGSVADVLVVSHDLTMRKNAEEALRLERDFTSAVLDTAGALVVVTDREGRISRFNRTCENLTGYDENEVRDRIFWDFLIPPEELQEVRKTWEAIRAGEFPKTHENHWLTKHGERLLIAWSNTALPDEAGEAWHVVATGIDITARNAAEAQIEQLNRNLQRRVAELEVMFGTSPIGLAIAEDSEGLRIRGNLALEKLTGVPSGTRLSLRDAEQPRYTVLQDGEEVPVEALPMQRACRGEKVTGEVLDILRGDGTIVTLYSSAMPIFDQNRNVHGAVGAFMDITERKRAEEALQKVNAELEQRVAEQTDKIRRGYDAVRAERQRFLDVLETLPVIVTLLRPDHRVEWVNRAYRLALGDNIGRLCYESQFGRDEPCEECQAFTPLTTREPHNWEWTLPDGRTFDIHNFPFADTDGSPLILEMDIDITERRRAEEALKLASTYNRSLIEASLDPLVTIGHDGKIMDVNTATEAATGLPRTELIGTDFCDYFRDPENARKGYEQAFREGAVRDYPLELRHRDGGLSSVLYNATVYRGAQGEVIGVFAAARDITKRKQAEEALKELNTTLEQRVADRTAELRRSEEAIRKSLHEKEVLLKEIHHRVKNNMQVISSLVSLQAEGAKDQTVREVLQDVIYRVRSMALVHEKLYRSTDLAQIDFADYAKSLLHYLWRSHGSVAASIRLNLNLQPVLLPVDIAVPSALILNELAGNALKHAFKGRDGGLVTVALHADDIGRVSLSVTDNGVGLPEGLDWRNAGSLGLRLVQMLTGQLDADVQVTNGEGTGFQIVFSGSC